VDCDYLFSAKIFRVHEVLHPVTKAARFPSFRNFVPKHAFNRYCWENTEFFVERDHGPPAEGAASFHTTRWTIVMRAAHSQAQGGQSAFAELCQLSEGRLGP
jgi:hypothetical protein